jgi:putative toxin-antitoxin system antitoxin component (TIGR02293 family)
MSAEKPKADDIQANVAAALARVRGNVGEDGGGEAVKAFNESLRRFREQIDALIGHAPSKPETPMVAARRRRLMTAAELATVATKVPRPIRPKMASAAVKPASPSARIEHAAPMGDAFISDVVRRLGGRQIWAKAKAPTTRLEVHETIRRGIPGKALGFVLGHVTEIPRDKLFNVIGISQRTVQRRAEAPEVPLSQEQGSRLWKFAEILTTATGLFGDQKSAERWLNSPAMALEQNAPVDLMTTQAGAELVEQLLTRLEHGVYT